MAFDWSAVASAGSGIIGSIVNLFNQERTNQANKEINKNNLDYQKATTQAAWERDDRFYQRSVSDAEAAGLSPLAINGAMTNTSPLGAPSPIPMQAPQLDTNALVQAVLGSAQLEEEKRHNLKGEEQRGEEISNDADRIEIMADQLELDNKKVEADIKYQAKMLKLESKRINETIRSNKAAETQKEKDYNLQKLSYESKRYYEEVKHQVGGEDIPYKVYKNFDEYKTAMETYQQAYLAMIEELGYTRGAMGQENAGIELNIFGKGSIGAQGTTKPYASEDWSKQQEEYIRKWRQDNPCPVYFFNGEF